MLYGAAGMSSGRLQRLGGVCWRCLDTDRSFSLYFGTDIVLLANTCILGWFVGGTLGGLAGCYACRLGVNWGQEAGRTSN